MNFTASGTTERKAERECAKIKDASAPFWELHIIGGEAASLGEFPHMVALGYKKEDVDPLGPDQYFFDCGGSMVSLTYVLTAAHCMVNVDGRKPMLIRAGISELGPNIWNEKTDYKIVEVLPHPSYRHSSKYHDIGLLRLEKPVHVSNNLNIACLYTDTADPSESLTVTGWGSISATKSLRSHVLLKTTVTPKTRKECGPYYKPQIYRKLQRSIIEEQICAGHPQGGHDACQGDSGGPLQIHINNEHVFRVVGVASFGSSCGTTVPGVYTRVASYLDWIESVVWPN